MLFHCVIMQYSFLWSINISSLRSLPSYVTIGPALCICLPSTYFSILSSDFVIFMLRADKWNSAFSQDRGTETRFTLQLKARRRKGRPDKTPQRFWDVGHMATSDRDPRMPETHKLRPIGLGIPWERVWGPTEEQGTRGPRALPWEERRFGEQEQGS